jgi:hypothetical protein
MSNKFEKWFNEAHNKWSENQPGEEDFLEFCSHLGYPPYQVLDWLHGDSTPTDSEVLNIAGLLGNEVYDMLNLEKPEQELLNIFNKFSHLRGEYRVNLATKLFEIENKINNEGLAINNPDVIKILNEAINSI